MLAVDALQFRGRVAVAVAAGVLALAACGGAAESNLFGGSGGGANGSDAATMPPATQQPDGSSGSMAPTGSQDSGTATDASMPGQDASGGPGPFSGGDADTIIDTGTTNAADSAPPPDQGIACGLFECKPKAEVCCLGVDGSGDQTLTCESASDCANESGFPVPCADSLDCLAAGSPAGTVCCVTEGSGTSSAASVACVAPSECTQVTQALMCDPTSTSSTSASGQCPAGDTCSESMVTIPPYSICVK
jgi:hypothetical protein